MFKITQASHVFVQRSEDVFDAAKNRSGSQIISLALPLGYIQNQWVYWGLFPRVKTAGE
jgi:hypothetical protein